MGDFEQMLNDLCKMSKAQLVQMVRNTDEVEIALNIFKNVMKEDYARVLRCKDCKYGSYDSKPNGAMICLRTNDGFWRKETDFAATENGGKNEHAHYKHQGQLAGGRGHLPRHLRKRLFGT